jgi:hypothetical protein
MSSAASSANSTKGRREIVEKLTRGLVLLEREEFEVKRELEQIKIVRDSFAEHLSQTENLNPADWSSEELPSELTKALARVDQAKGIYSQSRARLAALRQAEEGAGGRSSADLAPDWRFLREIVRGHGARGLRLLGASPRADQPFSPARLSCPSPLMAHAAVESQRS